MIGRGWQLIRSQITSIGGRLMALYLLLLLIPIVGVGLYGYLYMRNALAENAIESWLDEVTVRAMTIDALLSQIHDDILYLEQGIADNNGNATLALTGLAETHPMYRDIVWVNQDNQIVGGQFSSGLAAWAGQTAVTELAELVPNSIRFIHLRVQESTTTTPGEALLVAGAGLQSGILLFDINTAYLLQSTETGSTAGDWALLIDSNTLLTTSDDIQLELLGIEEMSQVNGSVRRDGRINLYQLAGPGQEWVLVHSIPTDEVIPNLQDYYTILFVMTLGGLVSVTGLALLAISRMIDPVYQLEKMVDRVRHGEPRQPLPNPLPSDEFGTLMTAFDQMAGELEQKRRNERALIEQLIRAQEEERKIIAYDLHDGLIQDLVGARFYLSQMRQSISIHLEGGKAKNFTRGYDVLTHAIAEGRRIIQGLHPTVLEDLGLEAALIELGKTMGETSEWQTHLDIATLDPQPDRATSVTLYRIAQEALNNAFKHAHAKEVWLNLSQSDEHIQLSIRDDGCGFDPTPILHNGSHGWGIRTMRERAAMLRGTCEISSQSGAGTTIEVTIPYDSSDKTEVEK